MSEKNGIRLEGKGLRNWPAFCYGCANITGAMSCKAFPDEIPDEIWNGAVPHDRPYPGDRGFQFSPVPKEPLSPERVAWLMREAKAQKI